MTSPRLHIQITGSVQGVGFRPTVSRIAVQLQLTGFVYNHSNGVHLEVQGDKADHFIENLKKNLPPLAKIDTITQKIIPSLQNETDFIIKKSTSQPAGFTKMPPDIGICHDCLKELFDFRSHYCLYPFINCTHCGPRFTIISGLPYDRDQTAMQPFPLCQHCSSDYKDSNNRRYHAQPTACRHCGPKLKGSIKEIAEKIQQGKIIALKGLGGYQLICDAKNKQSVRLLRKRKNRPSKPFAVMMLNIPSVKKFATCRAEEEKLLLSPVRPIVLLTKNSKKLVESTAPKLKSLGIMLPSTPLHYLLFHALLNFPKETNWLQEEQSIALIVTSANISCDPLLADDSETLQTLSSIADDIIPYNRKIIMRADDSVVKIINKNYPLMVRRARGYVPNGIPLKYKTPPILALGGHLKNTFCLTRDNEAYVSQHIGDLDSFKTREYFHQALDHFLSVLKIKPEIITCDKHPNYYTTQIASDFGLPIITIQHHHAHLAAVAAEHHITEPILGLALDGTGYGDDGQFWGGELLFLDDKGNFERLGSLLPMQLFGFDQAAKEPWRMAVSILHQLSFDVPKDAKSLLDKNFYPKTTSCGRLFDAAAGLLKTTPFNSYESQAAMELESLVTRPEILKNGWQFNNNLLNFLPLMKHLAASDKPIHGANIFHGTLAAAFAEWIAKNAAEIKIQKVLLSGGCFLNRVLTETLLTHLKTYNIIPVLPKELPPNDGGISLGQAWVAACLGI